MEQRTISDNIRMGLSNLFEYCSIHFDKGDLNNVMAWLKARVALRVLVTWEHLRMFGGNFQKSA